jgi:NhaP-type Na+/H+ or K+/H+ antiporter
MSRSEEGIMFFSGSIRGAIAFGLAVSIESHITSNRKVLITSTLILVFFTTVVFGALMPFIVKYFKKDTKESKELKENGGDTEQSKPKLETYSIERYERHRYILTYLSAALNNSFNNYSKRSIRGLWHRFDNNYMKPFFIDDWPKVKEDHDDISIKIISVFDEHMKRKLKDKELKQIVKNSRNSIEKTEQLLREVSLRKSTPQL